MLPDPQVLHARAVLLMAPVIRNLYTYPAPGQQYQELINPDGVVDVHDGQVLDVAMDAPGTEHTGAFPYAVLWQDPGSPTGRRMTGRASALRWAQPVTAGGGDPTRCMTAVGAVRRCLLGQRISERSGLLHESWDAQRPRQDRDVHPYRWFVQLEYATHSST